MSDHLPNPADADDAAITYPLRLGDLDGRKSHSFDIRPEKAALTALAKDLDLSALRKLRFEGALVPLGKRDWRLEAQLGATVVQPCVATLEPVTTRIDETVVRQYLANYAEIGADIESGDEVEMPEDDTIEALPATLDLSRVLAEALALAVPQWPRAPGADPAQMSVTEPGKSPLRDSDLRPFAGLREKLENKRDTGPD